MGKFYVFLFLVLLSCSGKHSSSVDNTKEKEKLGRHYDRLCKKAMKARQKYLKVVDMKVSGRKLDRAKIKMHEAEAKVDRFKNAIRPNTKHLNTSH
jgi:hypothetical protein